MLRRWPFGDKREGIVTASMRTHEAAAWAGSKLAWLLFCAVLGACHSSGKTEGAADDGGGDVTHDDFGHPAPNAGASASADGDGDVSATASVRWLGRVDTANAAGPHFAWSGTG